MCVQTLVVPARVRAIERERMVRATSMIWSSVMLPSCLTFLTCCSSSQAYTVHADILKRQL
eukprot:9483-Heterococcus_DN1.PRE.2